MSDRILIVDDSAAIRSFIRSYLSFQVFEFFEAADGDRALQIVRLVPIDLVIADINMPKTDGMEFLLQLRANRDKSLRALPVILLTADKAEHLPAKARAAGANHFLRKPIDPVRLIAVAKELLAKRSSSSSRPSRRAPSRASGDQKRGNERQTEDPPPGTGTSPPAGHSTRRRRSGS